MKRLCPGCITRRLQMDETPCVLCGSENRVEAPRRRETMRPLMRWMRYLLGPLAWRFHTMTLVACIFALWAMALHWVVPFPVLLGFLTSWVSTGLLWTLRLATRGAIWLFQPATRTFKRPGGRGFLVLPLCIVFLIVLNRFDVPLHVAFRLNQPTLEGLVRGAPLSPSVVNLPSRRLGLFHAFWINLSSKHATIQVTEDDVIFPTTLAGFAYCPQGWDAAVVASAFDFYFHREDLTKTRLSKEWYWWEVRTRN